jgi:hypothetical protein
MYPPNHHDPWRADVRDGQGVQVGNHNTMNNFFHQKRVIISLGSVAAAAVIIVALFLFSGPVSRAAGAIGDAFSNATENGGNGGNQRPNTGLPARASVVLTPTSGAKTAQITVSGTNFQAGEPVSVTVHMYEAALVNADATGAFSVKIRIPSDEFCPGNQCTIQAQGKDSVSWNDAVYTVR